MDREETTRAPRGQAPATFAQVAALFGRLAGLALALGVALGLLLTAAAVALPAPAAEQEVGPDRATSGRFLMRRGHDQPWAMAPTLSTEVSYRVAGVVARASVRQCFRNGTDAWVEASTCSRSRRPRPSTTCSCGSASARSRARSASVSRPRSSTGRRGTRAARRASWSRSGPTCSPRASPTSAPASSSSWRSSSSRRWPFDEGEVRRFPLVVGPRYIPGQEIAGGPKGLGWGTDAVPDASRITPPVLPPGEAPSNPVAIEVDLDAGFPVRQLSSRYHAIVSEAKGEGRYLVRLRDELAPADRDFELAWAPEPGTMPRGALFREERGGATYALVTLFPPVGPQVEATRLPREVVYVIDTSGSMNGPSIEQARRALLLAIDRLRPRDRFNVIQFNNDTEVLWDETRPATTESRAEARAWVERLRAEGGTEMAGALLTALAGRGDPRLVRQVVFLTDGSVGNEEQLFGIIRERLGDARLFTVGIVTKHTSLVAVDVTPSRPDGADLQTAAVPTNLPHGWVYESVFGQLPQTATPAPFHLLVAILWLLAAAALRLAAHARGTEHRS